MIFEPLGDQLRMFVYQAGAYQPVPWGGWVGLVINKSGAEPTVRLFLNGKNPLELECFPYEPEWAELAKEIREINAANGWDCPTQDDWNNQHWIPAMLNLIHSEVSEATEAWRTDDKENFGEELADNLIRTLDLGYSLGYDLQKLVRAKLEKNRLRAFKHGGKKL